MYFKGRASYLKVCLRAHSDVPQGSRDTLNILFGLPFRVAGKHFAAKHTDTHTQTQSRRELRRPLLPPPPTTTVN